MSERREALAWAAGIFDGEGCIGAISRPSGPPGRRVPHLRMSVSQFHDPDVIERFAADLGIGTVAPPRTRASGAQEWIWRAGGLENVQACIAMLWPWLSGPKRAQAAQAIESYHGRRAVLSVRAWRRRRIS